MLNTQINNFRRLERKKKLSSTIEYRIFLDFRRNFYTDKYSEANEFGKDFNFTDYNLGLLESQMLLVYDHLEGKLPASITSRNDYFEKLERLIFSDLSTFIRLVNERKEDGKFCGLSLTDFEEILPISQEDNESFNNLFFLFRPNLLLLGNSSFEMEARYLPVVVAYFFIFENLDKSPGHAYSPFYPEELTYSFKTKELKEAWKNKWKNPNFSKATFQNVSKEVQNMLLKDDKIEQLFANIYNNLSLGQKGRALPRITSSVYKNVLPLVKEKVEKNLQYMNYLYLEEEEKQPEEVREVKKQNINVENLLNKVSDILPKSLKDTVEKQWYLNSFYEILLDIMFSQILQELFKEYEFYHKKIVTMAPAIIEGDVKALEENENAQMKDFWKLGLVLYKLYFYLGMYKSIVGYREFYFKPEYADFCKDLIPFTQGCDLYWSLMKVMGDFELEIEGQESYNMEVKNFPQNGILKARIKRCVTEWYPYRRCVKREHLVCWNVQERRSKLEEKEGFFWQEERNGL